ncbi:hypothetical protein BMS3Abin03_02298 [bacterium BMS3Abin03]|nr:hypothetical protein BMS3Abin03_02298 [bacterium BMS3Abin03]
MKSKIKRIFKSSFMKYSLKMMIISHSLLFAGLVGISLYINETGDYISVIKDFGVNLIILFIAIFLIQNFIKIINSKYEQDREQELIELLGAEEYYNYRKFKESK